MMDIVFSVYVRCFTYNHASYIADALNGFTIQQTTFPYVCAIVDDASTDGTNLVIRDYLNQFFEKIDDEHIGVEENSDYSFWFLRHKTNHNCFFAIYFLKYNHYSIKKSKMPYLVKWTKAEYSTLCEGDDYWTDPLKLEKQVHYMDSHTNCSLCFHAHENVFTNHSFPNKIIRRYDTNMDYVPMKDMIISGGGFMATSSMLFKSEMITNKPAWALNTPVGDFPQMLLLATRGDVAYINDVMSCYRQDSNGSWSSRVTADKKMYLRWYKGIIKMMKGFDDWTDKKYHKYVCLQLFNHRKSRMRYELSRIKKIVINTIK